MKRYFYTDPLAAAWMSERFGMRFDEQLTAYAGPFIHDWRSRDRMNNIAGEYYIHPDSLPLLEHQKGDIIGSDDYALYVHEPKIIFRHHSTWDKERIIQRNGLAFHWPASEDV